MKPVKTWIAGLDEFLLGGLPPKVILLSGAPGSGNEVFARQVLFSFVRQAGGSVTYFTVNASVESVREEMASYGWDTVPFEETGTWKFKNLQTSSAAEPQEIVIEEMKQRRAIAVDSISELLLTHKTREIAQLVTSMTHQNRKSQEFHFLLLTEGMQDTQAETTMNHFAEGSMSFNITWAADAPMRQLIIRKLSGTIVPTRRLTYTLGRKGIIIETATRIT
jgi:KaiC/GvpD/RAD55 family RecA-like ATPase